MNKDSIQVGDIVYNFKHNYLRIYTGYSLAEFLSKLKDKNELFEKLDSCLGAVRRDFKLVLDSSSEAEIPRRDLEEIEKLYRLDWLVEWKDTRKVSDELFKIWVSDFRCVKNNKEYGYLFEPMNQYSNNVAYALDNEKLFLRDFDRKFICAMSRNTSERKSLFELFESNENLKNNTYYSFNYREGGIYPNPEEDEKLPHLPLERYGEEWEEVSRTQFAGFPYQNKSIINITCETFFHERLPIVGEQYQRFFTEKTFRPLAMCQPFIYVAQSGMLEKLKSYEFKTFGKWWDESYDSIEDSNLRLEAIKDLIVQLNKKPLDELREMYLDMIPTLQWNYKNVLNLHRFHEFHITHNYNGMGIDEFYYAPYHKIFN